MKAIVSLPLTTSWLRSKACAVRRDTSSHSTLAADVAGYSRLMGDDEAGTARAAGPITPT